MIEIQEYKAKKKGIVTPKSLLEELEKHIEHIESLIYIAVDKEGVIRIAYTEFKNNTDLLGLLETGKQEVYRKEFI